MANDSGRPELVLFDLGGVLCQFEPDLRAAELATAIGVTEEEIHALVFESGFDQECDLGLHSEAAILERLRAFGFPGNRDDLRRAWAKAFIPDRAVIDLAIALRSEGVEVATFSDNGPVLLAAIESVVTPLAIDEHVFSCILGATKPDPAAFLAALKFLNARPQQTFFVDDNPINVLSARQPGIRGEQVHAAAEVESALRSVGLLREQ
ncbi:HAD family phosphatase [Rhodococcus sp. IEGM 1409]|uniref:HAD family hydrolase n=1 Tax=Rhodococcus sp. IEGM 1409 TaxID=3047082 RepID=UPI0024B6C4BB|nr:HAD family phosphatase [Rhodococcus sp. IEGM 1409]MDI9900424.1 HAD family phosphatase [Rhodococcus sp. IEGM 1409]